MEVISCPCTLCVFILPTQNKLPKRGFAMSLLFREVCRQILEYGWRVPWGCLFAHCSMDAQILASLSSPFPSLFPKRCIPFVCLWNLQNADHKFSKICLFKRNAARLHFSYSHIWSKQTKHNCTCTVILVNCKPRRSHMSRFAKIQYWLQTSFLLMRL